MLRNPLVLDGVKLWFSPKLSMKVGGTSRIVCLLPPLNPSTISAANPLVNCESESALMMTRSSIISTEIHTYTRMLVSLGQLVNISVRHTPVKYNRAPETSLINTNHPCPHETYLVSFHSLILFENNQFSIPTVHSVLTFDKGGSFFAKKSSCL